MIFEFYQFTHSFIEGEVATKAGDCISKEKINFSRFPRFVASRKFQHTEDMLHQFQKLYCDI